MNTLVPIGRIFFATGLIAFGVMHFIYGDFVAGRAPAWPESMPGRIAWAYVSGGILIAAGAAIISGKIARTAAITAGTMIFLWALVRNIPIALADTGLGGDWTRLGKSLVFFGGAYAVAGSFPRTRGAGAFVEIISSRDSLLLVGRLTLGLFMILCGIQHFLFVEFVASLVPSWIPGANFWTYFAGIALMAGGAGLILPQTVRLAGGLSGLMIFLWVIMLHIPRAVAAVEASDGRNEWTSVFEALALSGLAVLLAALHQRKDESAPTRSYAGAGTGR